MPTYRLYPSGGHIFFLLLLAFINLVNYVDRMIITSTPIQFGDFIRTCTGAPASEETFWLGVLSASFVASFAVASIGIRPPRAPTTRPSGC